MLFQALCAQQLVKDRLGAPFWPSLVALQNASLSQLPPPPARPAAAKAGSSASTAMHVIDSDSGSLGGDTTEAEASLDPNAETSPPTATVDDETVDCAMVGASSEDTTVAGNVDLFAFEGAGGPSSPTTAPAEAVEGEEKPLADPLEKYRVHSVLLELTALVRYCTLCAISSSFILRLMAVCRFIQTEGSVGSGSSDHHNTGPAHQYR